MTVQTVEIVKIFPTHYWVESDVLGTKHIMVQHEGMEPFTYASFNYDYGYTSNSQIHNDVVAMMARFGIEEKDIVYKYRDRHNVYESEIALMKYTVQQCTNICEHQRQKILNNPDDPSWTEHLTECQNNMKILFGIDEE